MRDTVSKAINNDVDSDSVGIILWALIAALKPRIVVELGTRDGNTTLPILEAMSLVESHLYRYSRVYSVDTAQTSFICPEKYRHIWSFHHCDAIEFLRTWPTSEIMDLVFIDDWHAYEHVKEELHLLDKLVSPSSVILVHDTMYGHHQPHYHCDLTMKDGQWANGGPYRAVAELPSQFWEFSTIPVPHGLTVLRKKYSNLYHT